MRVEIIDEIQNYIQFVEKQYSLEITIHPMFFQDYLLHTQLVKYNSHRNNFCQQIKTHNDTNSKCINEQNSVFARCNVTEPFYYTCFAGVTQLIFPIHNQKSLVGYMAVGSFYLKDDNSSVILKNFCDENDFDYNNMKTFFDNSISEYKYSTEELKTICSPICSMIEVAYYQSKDIVVSHSNDSFYLSILAYIKTRYTSKITLEEMSAWHNCSISYISHFFKKQNGMSIPEYINSLRIRDAKMYLDMTNMSIQEIAYSVGFMNSNYFSTVFKSIVGCSPKEYRTNKE